MANSYVKCFTLIQIFLIYTHENQLLSKNIKRKGVAVSNA